MADKENKNTKPNNESAAEGLDYTIDADGKYHITIDTQSAANANDPRLDPKSEEFDLDYFKQVYDPQRIADVLTDFKEVLNNAYSGLATVFASDTAEVIRDIAEQTRQVIANNLPQMQTNFSKTWEAIKDSLPSAEELNQFAMFNYGYQLAIDKLAAANSITVEALIEQSEDADGEAIPGSLGEQAIVFARQFAALMLDELEKEDYQGQTFLSLISEYSQHQEGENRLIVQEGSPLDKAIAAVVKRANSIIDLQLFNNLGIKELPVISPISRIDFEQGVSKVDRTVWNLYEKDTLTQIDGQLSINTIPIAVENSLEARKGVERNIMYSIGFSELADDNPIMKRLTPFDKRVYFAIANLYAVGNEYLTVKMIHKEMGNTKNPSAAQREKILTSIKKMMGAIITLNNLQELMDIEYIEPKTGKKKRAKGYNYDDIDYNGNLLYAEFSEAIINGKQTETIHILKTPILYVFAKERGQITTFKREVLQIPLSQTDDNLLLQDYLIEEIQRIRKGKRDSKMLFTTIYENCNITTKMQISRAKEKIYSCLDYWTTADSKHFIKSYTKLKDGVEIHCK